MLTGAILVLCAVGGVQAQSITIDRQMERYHVPRLAFINKMDRTADPLKWSARSREARLRRGLDADSDRPRGRFRRVIDLISQQALYFDGNNGEKVRCEPIPAAMPKRPAGPARDARSAVDV